MYFLNRTSITLHVVVWSINNTIKGWSSGSQNFSFFNFVVKLSSINSTTVVANFQYWFYFIIIIFSIIIIVVVVVLLQLLLWL